MLKNFKVLCNNIVVKSVRENAVLLLTAFSWQKNLFSSLCVTFYGLVHFISATGRSPNPALCPEEAAKVKLSQTTTNAVLVCSVFLQVQFTVFSKQSFTDIHRSG